MPELKDSEFTWKGYQEANNNELVNNLANFVNRVVVLTGKYYEGKVPNFDPDLNIIGPDGEEEISFHDSEILRLFDDLQELATYIREFDFRSALRTLMEISTKGNQILQFNEPWKTIKTDPEQVKVVMNLGLQYLAAISVAVRPFMPFTSDRMRTLLNLPDIEEKGELLNLLDRLCEGEVIIENGHQIGKPTHLFSRITDKEIDVQIAKLGQEEEKIENPLKEEISFDDFLKMDIRTATITNAKPVPKADKLLELEVDLGFEKRTVVSGIAEHFRPEEIIGTKVALLANLAPRKIRGVVSKGMILMAEGENGKLGFVCPSDSWPNGMVVR
jgi:methionyl-tRNA synthetase